MGRSYPFEYHPFFFYNGQGNEGDEGHGRHEGHEGHEEEDREQDRQGQNGKGMVFRGSKEKTVGGMTAASLTKNKNGKVVSKKRSAFVKKSAWIAAVTKARKALGLKGFVAIKKGSALYKKAKELYQ